MNTRERIIRSFWELYSDNALEEISVGDIAVRAGIHRSTFYHYFKDRYEVLEAIENDLLNRLIPILEQLSLETLALSFHRMYLFLKVDGQYLQYLIGQHRDPNFACRLYRLIETNLQKLIGELFMDPNIEQKEMLYCSIAGVWISFLLSSQMEHLSEEKSFMMLVQVIFDGYLPGLMQVYGLSEKLSCTDLKEQILHQAESLTGQQKTTGTVSDSEKQKTCICQQTV